MAEREFVERREKFGDNTFRRVAEISCGGCGDKSSFPIEGGGRGFLPPIMIKRRFEKLGWLVGGHATKDLCPRCQLEKRRKAKEAQMLKVVSGASEKPPREMSREDKRIVFVKLNETYADEKVGYCSGWSDHRVATDLGVPRKWVEAVREEMFGSIGTNAEMQDFLSQAQDLLKDAKARCDEARKAREAVEAVLSSPQLASLMEITERLAKIERLAADIRKHVVTG